ncbi:hypothetical protein [Sphingosinicella rhizophila]|uniref:Uncharacterized protein n=1 Tax=Sphingosinicella rhizophila TaxID=3050082 RepID=A0ABU3Q9I1_9SPHN|nr:hypothetical protein [Sphingosinicella sp. GR2756]MDT9600052.1 hypothetical protein [Sphingosinicella sp. GR2756]
MSFRTPLPVLKDAIGQVFERGRADAIRPEFWAATHRRAPAEIAALVEAVRADRITRAPPNVADLPFGEGK